MSEVTSSKDSTIEFSRTYGVLKSSILCPGPSVSGARTSPCGHYMVLKKINDSKDGETWRCRKQHSVVKGNLKYNVKDVKLTIRHESWLVDSKVKPELITELIYLWSQTFTVDEMSLVYQKRLLSNVVSFSVKVASQQLWMKVK